MAPGMSACTGARPAGSVGLIATTGAEADDEADDGEVGVGELLGWTCALCPCGRTAMTTTARAKSAARPYHQRH